MPKRHYVFDIVFEQLTSWNTFRFFICFVLLVAMAYFAAGASFYTIVSSLAFIGVWVPFYIETLGFDKWLFPLQFLCFFLCCMLLVCSLSISATAFIAEPVFSYTAFLTLGVYFGLLDLFKGNTHLLANITGLAWLTNLQDNIVNKGGISLTRVQYFIQQQGDEYAALKDQLSRILTRDLSITTDVVQKGHGFFYALFSIVVYGFFLSSLLPQATVLGWVIPYPLFVFPLLSFALLSPIKYYFKSSIQWCTAQRDRVLNVARSAISYAIRNVADALMTRNGEAANQTHVEQNINLSLQERDRFISTKQWLDGLGGIFTAVSGLPVLGLLYLLSVNTVTFMPFLFVVLIGWPSLQESLNTTIQFFTSDTFNAIFRLRLFFQAQAEAQQAAWLVPQVEPTEVQGGGFRAIFSGDIAMYRHSSSPRFFGGLKIHFKEGVNYIQGSNGLGKSTLFRLLQGHAINQDNSAKIRIQGLKSKNHMFALSQKPWCPKLMPTWQAYVKGGDEQGHEALLETLLEQVCLSFADVCHNKKPKGLGQFSGGQVGKLAFARLLYQIHQKVHRGDVELGDKVFIMLDESFKGIDRISAHRILKNIKRYVHQSLQLTPVIALVSHNVGGDGHVIALEKDRSGQVSLSA